MFNSALEMAEEISAREQRVSTTNESISSISSHVGLGLGTPLADVSSGVCHLHSPDVPQKLTGLISLYTNPCRF